jgi:hypothetical protein
MGSWAHAFRIAGWQLLGAFAIFGVAMALDLAFSLEVPRSLSGIAMVIGAQAYVAAKELKSPGAITGRMWAVCARAAALTTVIQILLAALVVALAARSDPEFEKLGDWGANNPWILPVIIGAAYLVIFLLTALGLWFGGSTARKAAARQLTRGD